MIYKILADTVVIFHFLWIVFLISGAFFVKKYRVLKFFHIGGLAYALIIHIFNLYCPLTYLETWLRAKHDPSLSYEGSFISYYLEKLIYMEISNLTILALTVGLAASNFIFYLKNKEI